jgi:hypothetical protein
VAHSGLRASEALRRLRGAANAQKLVEDDEPIQVDAGERMNSAHEQHAYYELDSERARAHALRCPENDGHHSDERKSR